MRREVGKIACTCEKSATPTRRRISLGTYRYNGPLEAGKMYTRQEQVRLPVRTFGLYEAVVITNYRDELYEHGADDNNTRVDDTVIPITVRPRPDLQVTNFVAPDTVDPGQTVAVDFTVINQGSVATTVPNWTDRVYLSLDPVISSDGHSHRSGQQPISARAHATVPDHYGISRGS